MPNPLKNTFLPPNIKAFFHRTAVRLIGLFLIAAGLLLSLALFSYSAEDPSFNTATGQPPSNFLGYFGSYTSDILWQYFGFAALLLPVSLIAWGILTLRLKWNRLQFLRVFCFFPTLLLVMILLAALPVHPHWPAFSGYGGAIAPALYHPATDFLTVKYFPYPEIITLPILILFTLFGLALTLGIPFHLLKKWFLGLLRFLKEGLLSLYNVLTKRKAKQEEMKEPSFGESLPESILPPIQEELDLGKTELPETIKEKAKPKPSPLKSLKEDREYKKQFHLPKLDYLETPKAEKEPNISVEFMENRARQLEEVLEEYGVKGRIVNVRPGPVVTLFELEPAPGIKTTRVINLADDIARSMSAISVRIAVVPGQSVIGIELPNEKRAPVYLREMFASDEFRNSTKTLTLALGKDIGGKPTYTDLAKMPHLLIAGTTGSGKSVAINTMILSLLYRLTPDQCRLIMIDPKMLELSVYNGIPHLLSPVVTDPKKAVVALNWAVREMDDRYVQMSQMGVRNIEGYNKKLTDMIASGEPIVRTVQTGFDPETGEPIYEQEELNLKPFPYIVVIVDEMADLMLTAGKEIEVAVQRIAQKARASGIHLIMATQRPSVDVITGTIKANFPERISFRVTTKIDSRTILGDQGAEQLLGMGDMLYLAQGQRAIRLHGPFVSDKEVETITTHLRKQRPPEYVEAVTEESEETSGGSIPGVTDGDGDENSLYDRAVAIVLRDRKASTSYIQRQLRIGYNRAADLIDKMEAEGVISAPNHAGKREILVPGGN